MILRKLLVLGFAMIVMTGSLSAEAALTQTSAALEPWTIGVVDQVTKANLGQHVSIAHYERDGRAFISYYDATHGDLKLAYEASPGTGNCHNRNWNCETVDTGVFFTEDYDVGRYSSIDVIDALTPLAQGAQDEINLDVFLSHYAKIGISYFDSTRKALKFALWSCTTSSSCSWAITTVDDEDESRVIIGAFTSFYFDPDATPNIFYHAGWLTNLGSVKRAYLPANGAFMGGCRMGWRCEVIASDNCLAFGSNISADGGWVAFFDTYNSVDGILVIAHEVNFDTESPCPGGGGRWECRTLAALGNYPSLYNDGEHPMQVAYYDDVHGEIKYVIQTTPGQGNCSNTDYDCYTVDTIGMTTPGKKLSISLALDEEGHPIIAYQDFSMQIYPPKLKIARPAYIFGTHGNCGEPADGASILWPYWQCSQLDMGNKLAITVADYAAVSISPTGLATVAYSEFDDSLLVGRLKVAQQHFAVYLSLIMK